MTNGKPAKQDKLAIDPTSRLTRSVRKIDGYSMELVPLDLAGR